MFGKRIAKLRKLMGMSQQQLADEMSKVYDCKKMSRTSIAQWESGATIEIEAGNLLRAAKVLGVNPFWLRFGNKTWK